MRLRVGDGALELAAAARSSTRSGTTASSRYLNYLQALSVPGRGRRVPGLWTRVTRACTRLCGRTVTSALTLGRGSPGSPSRPIPGQVSCHCLTRRAGPVPEASTFDREPRPRVFAGPERLRSGRGGLARAARRQPAWSRAVETQRRDHAPVDEHGRHRLRLVVGGNPGGRLHAASSRKTASGARDARPLSRRFRPPLRVHASVPCRRPTTRNGRAWTTRRCCLQREASARYA